MPTSFVFFLPQQGLPSHRTIAVDVGINGDFLEIGAEGYDTREGDGKIIVMEHYDGKLRVHLYTDITQEGPTTSVDMESARICTNPTQTGSELPQEAGWYWVQQHTGARLEAMEVIKEGEELKVCTNIGPRPLKYYASWRWERAEIPKWAMDRQ